MRNNVHSNRQITSRAFALLVLAGVFIMALGLAAILPSRAWSAAAGGSPNISAKAGSSGVTEGLFVTLSADGVIATASSPSDAVVGVCRTTAAATKITSYAPVGAQTTVTSGEAITAGDLLTAGSGGKAFVLDADDTLTQRICAVAVTSAVGANHDVDVIVTAAAAEQRLAVTGNTTITGNLTLPAANALKLRDANATISSSTTGTLDIAAATLVTSSAAVRLATNKALQFRDANATISSSATGKLTVAGDATFTGATTIDGDFVVNFGTSTYYGDANATIASPSTGMLALCSSSRITAESPIVGVNEAVTAINGNVSLDANSSGTVYDVTADAVITLPATAAGITYTFICDGADGDVQITLSPNSSDLIRGKGYDGADNTDWINTKATADRGDYITIVGDGDAGWLIQRQGGTWTHE